MRMKGSSQSKEKTKCLHVFRREREREIERGRERQTDRQIERK